MRGFAFSVFAFLVVLAGVYAQVGDPAKQVSIVAEGKDVREALRTLFKQVGISYSIAPEIQGNVNLKMENVPFERALRSVLAQVDAIYRVEGDVCQIIQLEPPRKIRVGSDSRVITTLQMEDWSKPAITQDGKYLYILRGNTVYKVEKSSLKTVSQRGLGQ